MTSKRLLLLAVIPLSTLLLAGGLALAQSGGLYDLAWNSVDGGSGRMSAETYTLWGTAGQADAGQVMTGGDYSLQGGFWNGAAAPVVLHVPVQFRN